MGGVVVCVVFCPRQAMLEAKQKELQNAMYTDGNGQNAFDAEEAMLAVRRPP